MSNPKARHSETDSLNKGNPAVETKSPPTADPGATPQSTLAEKIKELVRLAQEQGHLTYNDINEVLPESTATPEQLDEVFSRLRILEIEVVDQAEVDRVKMPDEEEDNTHLDALDDP